MLKLSHSSVSKYLQCPKSYEYSYINKYKSNVTGASLIFGKALDTALDVLLTKPMDDANAAFIAAWDQAYINDIKVSVRDSIQIAYAEADFDKDLLSQEDLAEIVEFQGNLVPELGNMTVFEARAQVASFKKQKAFREFKENENKFLNVCSWYSMRQKGLLMLDTYRKQILPKIKRVLATQEKIEYTNGDGDTLVGFVDLVVKWEDDSILVLDNKTAAREYSEDSVTTSSQLAIYDYFLKEKYNTSGAGFIVLKKLITKNKVKLCSKCGYDGSAGRHATCNNTSDSSKRCGGAWNETVNPVAEVQVLIDKIPDRLTDIVLENYKEVATLIKAKIFPRNLGICNDIYGARCPYYNICYNNDDSELVKP